MAEAAEEVLRLLDRMEGGQSRPQILDVDHMLRGCGIIGGGGPVGGWGVGSTRGF